MTARRCPPEAQHTTDWLTPEIRALLAQIPEPHARKKRTTVIRLAFARANSQPSRPVFSQPDTCAEVIWYGKWQYAPEIRAAFDACYQRALAWADEETATIEATYRQQRKRDTAKYAANAPAALAAVMAGPEQRGVDRINAAVTLIKLAEPETARDATTVPAGTSMEQAINLTLKDLSDDELERLVRGGDTADPAGGGGGVPAAAPGA